MRRHTQVTPHTQPPLFRITLSLTISASLRPVLSYRGAPPHRGPPRSTGRGGSRRSSFQVVISWWQMQPIALRTDSGLLLLR